MNLFIDFETTGLITPSTDFMAQPGIVQIGAIKQQGIALYEEFTTFVNPEKSKWEDAAIKTHGITPEQVKDAPTFFEVLPKLAEFVNGCDVWIGFNSKFDRDVLWHQLMRYGFERNFPWPPKDIDVMKLAQDRLELQGKRGNKRPNLSEAYEAIVGKPMQGAHDALEDIKATAELYNEIMLRRDFDEEGFSSVQASIAAGRGEGL